MHTNLHLKPTTIQDIDRRVQKLLRDLGNPAPPIRLDQVRTLLRLDLGYYSTADDSWLKQKIHELRVAGKQILLQPSLILDAVRTHSLKGLLLPDRRQVLLDRDVPEIKHRWTEAHEIMHDILDWHDGVAHGDPEYTLKPECHELIEAEANYGAGRLLFAGERFVEELRASNLDLGRIRSLQKAYGNTITTTFWRCVELSHESVFGVVSCHPRQGVGLHEQDIRYFVRSRRFATEFSLVSAEALWGLIRQYCRGNRGPLGSCTCPVSDDRSEGHEFLLETFFNGHDALTLGTHTRALTTAHSTLS